MPGAYGGRGTLESGGKSHFPEQNWQRRLLSRLPRLPQNLGKLEKAEALSDFQSCPAARTAGAGRLKAAENPFPEQKLAAAAALASPSTQLVKDFFDNRQMISSPCSRIQAVSTS